MRILKGILFIRVGNRPRGAPHTPFTGEGTRGTKNTLSLQLRVSQVRMFRGRHREGWSPWRLSAFSVSSLKRQCTMGLALEGDVIHGHKMAVSSPASLRWEGEQEARYLF